MDVRKIHKANEVWKDWAPAIVGVAAIVLLIVYRLW